MTYSLYHGDDPNTHTDDPQAVIAHAKAKGHRLTTPGTRRIPSLPRLTLPTLNDQPAEKVYQELAKSIGKHEDWDDSCAREVGKVDEDGYWLEATDGHRALMRVEDGTERERFPAKTARQFTPGPVQFVLNRPFADVWRRMSVLANGWIELELSGCSACAGTTGPHTPIMLTLNARDEDGDTATEIYPLSGRMARPSDTAARIDAEPVSFRLNPKYLAPLLRFWPITVAYRPSAEGSDLPLVFSPAGVDWRYILMPLRS